jgi:1,2-diacylglycerol 3-alpha-glucosyltransferase
MRIAHLCLANFYIDGFGYQENVLTKLHHEMGHEVVIIASTETYIDHTRLGYVEPASYLNEHGVQVHRLPYASWVPPKLRSKVRAYEGLEARLEEFRPDLIFVHDVQFWDLLAVQRYVGRRPTPVYADCHADYVNSARGFVSRRLLHGVFYRQILQRVDPIINRYLPTLPARADFLHEVYGLSRDKMELLPFGADDSLTKGLDRAVVRDVVRSGLGIPDDAVVLVTGGKLDLRKNIHTLIERFSALKASGRLAGMHLLVFGQPDPSVRAALDDIKVHPDVHLQGWMQAKDIFRMFLAADLAIFPGTHSVLWEEAIGHGLGVVAHHWPGLHHLDLGGNLKFIHDASPDALDELLQGLWDDNASMVRAMTEVAAEKGPRVFSFSAIAAQAIRRDPLPAHSFNEKPLGSLPGGS